jgi:hypothetical protein
VGSKRPDRVGVLVVRVWIEGDSETSLRARITRTLDILSGEEEVATTSSVDEVLTRVRLWLEEFVAG